MFFFSSLKQESLSSWCDEQGNLEVPAEDGTNVGDKKTIQNKLYTL